MGHLKLRCRHAQIASRCFFKALQRGCEFRVEVLTNSCHRARHFCLFSASLSNKIEQQSLTHTTTAILWTGAMLLENGAASPQPEELQAWCVDVPFTTEYGTKYASPCSTSKFWGLLDQFNQNESVNVLIKANSTPEAIVHGKMLPVTQRFSAGSTAECGTFANRYLRRTSPITRRLTALALIR